MNGFASPLLLTNIHAPNMRICVARVCSSKNIEELEFGSLCFMIPSEIGVEKPSKVHSLVSINIIRSMKRSVSDFVLDGILVSKMVGDSAQGLAMVNIAVQGPQILSLEKIQIEPPVRCGDVLYCIDGTDEEIKICSSSQYIQVETGTKGIKIGWVMDSSHQEYMRVFISIQVLHLQKRLI